MYSYNVNEMGCPYIPLPTELMFVFSRSVLFWNHVQTVLLFQPFV